MAVAGGIGLALLGFAVLVLLAGITPFIGIPVAVVLLVIPLAWGAATARLAREKRSLDKAGVPSTEDASYQPTVDPAERP